MKGRTSVNVTHKLDRVRGKKCIFVVKGGKVVEEGSYDELIDIGGIFSGMLSDGK